MLLIFFVTSFRTIYGELSSIVEPNVLSSFGDFRFFLTLKNSLLVRYLHILGSQNVDFLVTWAEITNMPEGKQITFHREDFMYHKLPGLPQRSQI